MGKDDMTRVALVEDNAAMRKNLERMLERSGGVECVSSCGTVMEALQKLPALKPDVVLMDINLPDGTGIECTARLKLLLPATQVIMLTVYEDTSSIFSALKAGACGYLLKSASPSEILEALVTVQSGGAPMTSEIARKIVTAFQSTSSNTTGNPESLSERESEILELLCEGKVSKEIAEKLSISYHTVRVHLKHIYEKLHVKSRSEAMIKFMTDKGVSTMGSQPR